MENRTADKQMEHTHSAEELELEEAIALSLQGSVDIEAGSLEERLRQEEEQQPEATMAEGMRFSVGDRARVKPTVDRPTYGWGQVKHGDTGTIIAIKGDVLTIDFPSQKTWTGLSSDMERCQDLVVGAGVTVVTAFTANDESKAHLSEGLHGFVHEIDEDGDACINFQGMGKLKWVCTRNFDKLRIDKQVNGSTPHLIAAVFTLSTNDPALLADTQVLERLTVVTRNLATSPEEKKYHLLKLSNTKVQRFLKCPGAEGVLLAVGFERIEGALQIRSSLTTSEIAGNSQAALDMITKLSTGAEAHSSQIPPESLNSQANAQVPNQEKEIRFLPKVMDGVAVLIHEGGGRYRADNSQLRAGSDGIGLRRTKNMTDLANSPSGIEFAKWGRSFDAKDEGDGWVKFEVSQALAEEAQIREAVEEAAIQEAIAASKREADLQQERSFANGGQVEVDLSTFGQ